MPVTTASTVVEPAAMPLSMPIWVSSGPAWRATVSATTRAKAPASDRRWGRRNERSVNDAPGRWDGSNSTCSGGWSGSASSSRLARAASSGGMPAKGRPLPAPPPRGPPKGEPAGGPMPIT